MAFTVLLQGSSLLWSIVLALVLIVLAFLLKMYQARRVFWRLRQQGIVCGLMHPAPSLLLTGSAYRPMASHMGPLPAALLVSWKPSKWSQYGIPTG